MIKRYFLCFLFLFLSISKPSINASVAKTTSLAVNDNQFIFISNPQKSRIQVYDSYGIYVKDAPSQEKFTSIQKIVSCPCGGYLLVFDSFKNEIVAIDDRSGEVLRRIKGIALIGDITISREKSRYEGIANLSTNSVQLYTDEGKLIRTIKNNSLFIEPSSILLNDQNHLFIADNTSQKIIELDIKGSFLRTISGSDFTFGKILDMTSDQKGNLYVLDEIKGLFKFSSQGQKLLSIPYPSYFKPLEIGLDDSESSIYLFSESTLQKLSLDFKEKMKVQKPLLAIKKTVIQLKIGSRVFTPIGFDVKIMDTAPFIESSSNRTFVPLRVISESFKATVLWDSKLNEVKIKKADTQIQLWINNKTAKVNGVIKKLEAPPIIKDNRTFVPLRFIGEIFSAEVLWYPEPRLIRIISPFIE